MRVTTKSGSEYLLSKEALTWERIPGESDPEKDNPLIINKGLLEFFPSVKLGERLSITGFEDEGEQLRLFGERRRRRADCLFLSTEVVKIEE